MQNGFGLKLLYKFFNLPFLQLQRETLLKQLERNEAEVKATIQELDIFYSSEEANYDCYLEKLTKKRRAIADSNANIPPQPASVMVSNDMKRSQSGPIVIGAGKPIPFNVTKSISHNSAFTKNDNILPELKKVEINPIASVEEFCPDGGQIDRSFLEDVLQSSPRNYTNETNDSDSDVDTGNPLVSELQEDIEPEDVKLQQNIIKNKQRRPISDGSDGDMKQTNDEFDSTLNSEISELTSEAFDAWMGADSKWRRSPEGGEDVSALSQTFDCTNSTVYDDTTSVTSSNVHMELLSSKHSQGGSITDSVQNSDNDEHNSKKNNKKEKVRTLLLLWVFFFKLNILF